MALIEATVISAGFAATAASFMRSSDTLDQYNRYAKYTHISIILFAGSAVLEAINSGNALTPIIFTVGWVMLVLSLGAATFSAEIVGVQANLRHRLLWLYRYRLRGSANSDSQPTHAIEHNPFVLDFLRPLYEGQLVRGTSIFVSGAAETNPEFFAYQIALEGLENDEHVIFINTKQVPGQVRDYFKAIGAELDRFNLIDIYNPTFGLGEIPITGNREKYRAKTLKGLHREIRRIRSTIGLEDDRFVVRIIYDDIDLLSSIMGFRGTNKFILHSLPVEQVLGWVTVYIGSPTHNETRLHDTVWNLSDIILQLEKDPSDSNRLSSVRLIKAQEQPHSTEWRQYTVQGRAVTSNGNKYENENGFIEIQAPDSSESDDHSSRCD